MIKEDVLAVWEIEKKSFPCPWSLKSFYDEIEAPERALYHVVETDNKKIIAFGGMWLILNEGHITNIAVDVDYRHLGVGKLLVKKMLEEAKECFIEQVTLEVRETNTIAQQLYKKFGFKVCGRRKAYYLDNREDALIMWVDICEEEERWD